MDEADRPEHRRHDAPAGETCPGEAAQGRRLRGRPQGLCRGPRRQGDAVLRLGRPGPSGARPRDRRAGRHHDGLADVHEFPPRRDQLPPQGQHALLRPAHPGPAHRRRHHRDDAVRAGLQGHQGPQQPAAGRRSHHRLQRLQHLAAAAAHHHRPRRLHREQEALRGEVVGAADVDDADHPAHPHVPDAGRGLQRHAHWPGEGRRRR
mmetsp:Transcript_14595/g.43753  ORF Transcript_14595/g.43753 Transcript_14595/m.43753 type:complete len:206 (-) Transcript_14595:796-1413(-)